MKAEQECLGGQKHGIVPANLLGKLDCKSVGNSRGFPTCKGRFLSFHPLIDKSAQTRAQDANLVELCLERLALNDLIKELGFVVKGCQTAPVCTPVAQESLTM